MYIHIAVGIDGAVEGVVAEVVKVVCKKVVCLYVQVVAQAGEMLVVDESVDISCIAVGIAYYGIAQLNLVGYEPDGVVVKRVSAVERTNHRAAVYHYLAREVDGAQRTGKPHVAHCPPVNLADEALGEGVHEIDVGAVGTYGKVNIVFLWRYIALYYCSRVVAVVGYGVDVYLALGGVPVHLGVEHTHPSVFKEEVVDG